MEKYDITDYLKDDKELQKAVIEEFLKEIAELKAENEKLKVEIKEVKKYQYKQEYLDKEIEEMQKALKTLAEGLNKRQILLQEIKTIAEKEYYTIEPEARYITDKILQKISEVTK